MEGLIKSIVEVYRGQDNLHTISVDLEEGLPQVVSDPERIAQVMGNLLSNALKYSPEGGPVEIRVFRRSAKELEISVRDQGLGIPPDALVNLFRPFFRVDNSDRRQIGGTGLGLAICQKIIQALGGNIWVQSEHGQGSTFVFTLPIVIMPSHYEKTSQKQVAVSAEEYILVVEDDPAMANLVCETLYVAGYATKITDNGPEALDIVRDRLPIAVILDLILPGPLDGWEVLRRLKMNGRTREVPVIISSCLDQREHGLELGVADYLVKPFSPANLVNSVTAVTKIASGVIGLTGSDHPDIKRSVEGLLKGKGFTVKEVKGEADLLFVTLNHPTDKEKEAVQNGTDQKLSQ